MPAQNIDVILRLLNSRRFQAEMTASAASIRRMTTALEEAQVASSGLAAAQKSMAAGMYVLGGATRFVGKGLGLAAGAATIMGLKFNATMESNTLAFEKFTGGAKQARALLNDLFETAANTPFTFEDITTATRRLMAFGFNAKEASSWMKTLGDTISYTGGGTDEILRAVKAIGEIRGLGRLQQRQILQLTNLGVGAHDILTKNLGLTERQLRNIGRAGISAEEALGALQKGFNETYGGGAEKYSKTLVGRLEKAKDYAQRAFGALTKPLFNVLRDKALPWIIDKFQKLNKWAQGDGMKNFSKKVGPVIGKVFGVIKDAVGKFLDAIKPMEPFWKNVLWPFIKGLAKGLAVTLAVAFTVVVGAIKIFAHVLGFVGKLLKPFRGAFELIGNILSWFAGGVVLKVISLFGKFGFVFKLIAGAAKLSWPVLKFAGVIFEGIGRAVWFVVRPIGMLLSKIPGVLSFFGRIGGVAKRAGWALTHGFMSALWKIFTFFPKLQAKIFAKVLDIGEGVAKWFVHGLKGIGKKILGVFTTGVAFFASVGRGIADWLNDNTPFGDRVGVGPVHFTIPKLATGGFLAEGGYAWVGERGPELVRLPTGSQVIPHGPAMALTGGPRAKVPLQPFKRTRHTKEGSDLAMAAGEGPTFNDPKFHFTIPVMVGRREIGRAVGEYAAEREARS